MVVVTATPATAARLTMLLRRAGTTGNTTHMALTHTHDTRNMRTLHTHSMTAHSATPQQRQMRSSQLIATQYNRAARGSTAAMASGTTFPQCTPRSCVNGRQTTRVSSSSAMGMRSTSSCAATFVAAACSLCAPSPRRPPRASPRTGHQPAGPRLRQFLRHACRMRRVRRLRPRPRRRHRRVHPRHLAPPPTARGAARCSSCPSRKARAAASGRRSVAAPSSGSPPRRLAWTVRRRSRRRRRGRSRWCSAWRRCGRCSARRSGTWSGSARATGMRSMTVLLSLCQHASSTSCSLAPRAWCLWCGSVARRPTHDSPCAVLCCLRVRAGPHGPARVFGPHGSPGLTARFLSVSCNRA